MNIKFKKFTAAIIAALSCLSMTTLPAFATDNYRCSSEVGVWIRSGPGTENNTVGLVNTGETVYVSDTDDNGWAKVTYYDDYGNVTYGWSALYYYEPISTDYTSISGSTYSYSYDSQNNSDIIYYTLINDFGFNRAAACAILANINAESAFNPTACCIDTNGLISYGLCQWNGPRYFNLLNYCNERGLDEQTIEAQLQFLKYELDTSYYNQYLEMWNTNDSEEGCYNASYYWASNFEICSSDYWTYRAELAVKYYNS